jgi:RNA polymerase II subunit A C-terminal domain phosphatase SSU72
MPDPRLARRLEQQQQQQQPVAAPTPPGPPPGPPPDETLESMTVEKVEERAYTATPPATLPPGEDFTLKFCTVCASNQNRYIEILWQSHVKPPMEEY